MGAVRVVELMKAADATVAEAGANELADIASTEEGKQAVFEAGGVAVLMEALARHKTHADVCEEASFALSRITCGNEEGKQALVVSLC